MVLMVVTVQMRAEELVVEPEGIFYFAPSKRFWVPIKYRPVVEVGERGRHAPETWEAKSLERGGGRVRDGQKVWANL